MWIFKWAAATVRSCSQGLRKQRFLSTWVMQSVLFLSCDSLWLDVGAFLLASETHHKFLALLQQTAICKLWWSDQNYYCAEYILLSFNPGQAGGFACRLRPLAREHIEYWLVTQIPISGYGGWHTQSDTRGQALNGPQTEHNSKLSFHDWIKIRTGSNTPRYTHTWNCYSVWGNHILDYIYKRWDERCTSSGRIVSGSQNLPI